MTTTQDLVNPKRPFAALGVDPSTAIGAQILALRLRRYWLDQNLDVPCEVYIVQSRVDERGGARCGQTIYSARADFKAAQKVDEVRRLALILSIENEAETFV